MLHRILVCAALVLAAPLAGAGIVTVGPAGSGADFRSIQFAISASQAGDVILLAPGAYSGNGAIVVDKTLTILGAGAATTSYRADSTGLFDVPHTLVVENLSAGEEVRVSGLDLKPSSFVSLHNATSVKISNCAGAVVLSGVRSVMSSGFAVFPGTFAIEDSKNVTLVDCEVRPADGTPAAQLGEPGGTMGIAGIWVNNSTLSINSSRITGAEGGQGGAQQGALDGGYGVVATDSTLRVARSAITGGRGGVGLLSPPEIGGVGISGIRSKVYIRGGALNDIRGGSGVAGSSGGLPTTSLGAAAVQVDEASVLTTAADSGLASGANGDGTFTTPTLAIQGSHIAFPEALATIEPSVFRVSPGEQFHVTLESEPFSNFWTFYSFEQGPPVEIPGVFGVVRLDVEALWLGAVNHASSLGQAVLTLTIPADPALVGISAVAQTLGVSPSAVFGLSALTMVEIQ